MASRKTYFGVELREDTIKSTQIPLDILLEYYELHGPTNNDSSIIKLQDLISSNSKRILSNLNSFGTLKLYADDILRGALTYYPLSVKSKDLDVEICPRMEIDSTFRISLNIMVRYYDIETIRKFEKVFNEMYMYQSSEDNG